jgi:hypothetical protein
LLAAAQAEALRHQLEAAVVVALVDCCKVLSHYLRLLM